MTNFTKGPWNWNKHGNRCFQGDGGGIGQTAICDIVRTADFQANRALIAAAPDLYEALKASRAVLQSVPATGDIVQAICRIDAALAKADGK